MFELYRFPDYGIAAASTNQKKGGVPKEPRFEVATIGGESNKRTDKLSSAGENFIRTVPLCIQHSRNTAPGQ